jgi:tartronate-semialdehyde synthase
VPVVVEFILERVTNIAMGTEIDNIVEFEEILDLPLDGASDVAEEKQEELEPA